LTCGFDFIWDALATTLDFEERIERFWWLGGERSRLELRSLISVLDVAGPVTLELTDCENEDESPSGLTWV